MAHVLQKGLEEECYTVSLAANGSTAINLAEREDFDLIVLDVMLPGVNGLEVARRLRENQRKVPILMLTARDSVPDVVKGLDAGADDYVTKPFSFAVLLARIRALERRTSESHRPSLRVDDVVLDIADRRAYRGSRELHLTPTEFRLLEFLMRRRNRVSTRREILEFVWGSGENVEDNTLDVFVRLLRRKVDQDEPVKRIQTVRGLGYLFEANS